MKSVKINKASLLQVLVGSETSEEYINRLLSEDQSPSFVEGGHLTKSVKSRDNQSQTYDNNLARSNLATNVSYQTLSRQLIHPQNTDSDTELYTLCILRWDFGEEEVDYFLIFSIDPVSQAKSYLGHSVFNTFVWNTDSPTDKYKTFCVQPVFTHAGHGNCGCIYLE